jgi:hypothetical protein
MYTEFIVWCATENDMKPYSKYTSFDDAKKCADRLRKQQNGTISIERVQHEMVYYA